MECWQEKENREFLRTGTVAAAIYNIARAFGGNRGKTLTAFDIFNLPRPESPKPNKKDLLANAEKVFSIVNARHAKRQGKKSKKPIKKEVA